MVEDLEDPRREEPPFVLGRARDARGLARVPPHHAAAEVRRPRRRGPQAPAGADVEAVAARTACGTWPRSSATGSSACCCAKPDTPPIWFDPAIEDSELVPARRRRLGSRPGRVAGRVRRESPGRGRARARRHRHPARRAVLVALDLRAHDRGVRAPQRPRRPHPRARSTEASAGRRASRWTSARGEPRRTGTTGPRSISRSEFYDVEGWLRDERGPRPREVEALGDVSGLRLVHLQCHFGLDTWQWARAGARVTGLDFSPAAIDAARDIARACRSRRSVRVRVCERVRRGRGARPRDVRRRVRESRRAVLAAERRPVGGAGRCARRARRALLHPRRPSAGVVAGRRQPRVRAHVLRRGRAVRRGLRRDLHRRRSRPLVHDAQYEWNHSIGEIVTAVIRHGLRVDSARRARLDGVALVRRGWCETRRAVDHAAG